MMDEQSLRRLIAALAAQGAQGQAGPQAPSALSPEVLRALLAALQEQQAAAAPANLPVASTAAINPLQLLLGAFLGRMPAAGAAGGQTLPLSPIDKLFGGEALAGKKTVIALVAFAALAIVNPGVLAGTAVGAPAILGTLIKSFGGLGMLAKVDRVIQALALIASRPGVSTALVPLLTNLLARAAAQKPPVPLPPQRPPVAPAGRTITISGKMSTFGGPLDHGVKPSEGLALVEPPQVPQFPGCFLPAQPPDTTGLARRLNPDAAYIACRWEYKVTPKAHLRAVKVEVINPQTGQRELAQPVDWGPSEDTGRVADLSPGLARRLGLETDDVCQVVIPLPAGAEAPSPPVHGKPAQSGNVTIWVVSAAADIGTHEIKGPKVNQTILAALDWADGGKDGHFVQSIDDDETPWCSSWLCGKLEMVGIRSPRSAWAQSWASWGQPLSGPAVGCVVVFRWSAKAGHVGLVVGRSSGGSLMVLGGNQKDAVNVKPFKTGQVLAYRWPDGFDMPAAVGMSALPVTSQENVVTTFKDTR